jgi:hypothetical protein
MRRAMRLRCHHVWVPWLGSQTCTRCGVIRDLVLDDSTEITHIRYTYPAPPPPPRPDPHAPALVDFDVAFVRLTAEAAALNALDAQDAAWNDIPPEPD